MKRQEKAPVKVRLSTHLLLTVFTVLLVVLALWAAHSFYRPNTTYRITADDTSQGRLSLQNVDKSSLITHQGDEARLFNASTVTLQVRSPKEIKSITIDAEFAGNNRVYVRDAASLVSRTIYDPAWENYTRVASFPEGEIWVDNEVWDNTFTQDTEGDIYAWIQENIPAQAGLEDPANALNWSRLSPRHATLVERELDGTFRGTLSIIAQPLNNTLSLSITKTDRNYHEGEDSMGITIRDLQGIIIQSETLQDDSDISESGKAGKAQYKSYAFTQLPDPYYVIELTSDSRGDDFEYSLQLTSAHYVITNNVFSTKKYTARILCEKDCTLSAQTNHDWARQNITIDGERLEIRDVGTSYTRTLSPGTHTLSVPKGSIILKGFDYYTLEVDGSLLPFHYQRNSGPFLLKNPQTVQPIKSGHTYTVDFVGKAPMYFKRANVELHYEQ